MKRWIYKLPKEQLARVAQQYHLDSTGTTDDIRRAVSAYVTDHPEEFATMSEEGKGAGGAHHINETGQEIDAPDTMITSKVMNQIRKWGVHFDGRDPVAFLERVEELQAAYGYTDLQMITGLTEMLRGEALLWYRNHRTQWTTWGDFVRTFRRHYLTHDYADQLQQRIFECRQAKDERFLQYATRMLTLIRRAGGFSKEAQLTRVFKNLRPEYKMYIRREGVHSMADLEDQAQEFEEIETERQTLRPQASHAPKPALAATYDRATCCWRCKQRGHTRQRCRQPAKKFCSRCGKDGIFTKDCHPAAGNARRAEEAPGSPRPENQSP